MMMISERSEKRNLQILGNTGSEHHQTCGDERKNKKEERDNQTTLPKSYQRAVAFVRYSGLFLKWTREELQQMEQKWRRKST